MTLNFQILKSDMWHALWNTDWSSNYSNITFILWCLRNGSCSRYFFVLQYQHWWRMLVTPVSDSHQHVKIVSHVYQFWIVGTLMKNRIMKFYAELEEYTIGIYSEKIRDYVRSRYPTLAGMNTRWKRSKSYPGIPRPRGPTLRSLRPWSYWETFVHHR